MSKEHQLILAKSDEIPMGGFAVARIKQNDGTGLFEPEDIEIVFEGTDIKADLLFGWGIARGISNKEGAVIVLVNTDEEVQLPNNISEQ